jgi:hypothetical protein
MDIFFRGSFIFSYRSQIVVAMKITHKKAAGRDKQTNIEMIKIPGMNGLV